MSAWYSYAGAALLVAATLPQAARLWRTRDASGFTWSFVALNAAGIILLAARSAELHEWGYVAVNTFTVGFWILSSGVKARAAMTSSVSKRSMENTELR